MHSWEQLPDESPEQFRAFNCYLKERSINAAYRAYIKTKKRQKAVKSGGKASSTFSMWSKAYRWQERARDYDAFMQQSDIDAKSKALNDYYKQQSELYRKMAQKAHQLVENKMNDVENVKMAEAVQVVEYYSKEYLAFLERENFLKFREVLQK